MGSANPPIPPLAEATLGPAPRFRIEGRSLQFGPRNDEIATYRTNRWHSGDETFAILESETPTLVTFEGGDLDEPQDFGPFRAVQVTEGAIRFGPAGHQVVAVFDEACDCWLISSSGDRSAVVLLSPADDSVESEEEAEFTADDFVKKDYSQSRPDFRAQPRRLSRVGDAHP